MVNLTCSKPLNIVHAINSRYVTTRLREGGRRGERGRGGRGGDERWGENRILKSRVLILVNLALRIKLLQIEYTIIYRACMTSHTLDKFLLKR